MDEELDNPVADEATQEPTNEAENDEATQADNPEDQDTEGDESADELEEIEYSGNKYKVPKELAPILAKAEGLQSDYTKKTMTLAEERKAVEAERESIRHEEQLSHEIIGDLSQLRAIEAELATYQNVNWQQWQFSDRDAAAAGMARMMQLQNSHRQAHGQVEARKAEVATIRQQQSAKATSQALEALSKPDPDKGWDGKFDDAKRDKLTKFGREIGYTDEELAGTSHPLMIKTLHLAQIGLEALKKSRAATKAPPKVEAKPVPEIGKSKGTVIKGLDDRLSTEEWVRRRNAQAAKFG